MKVSIFILIFIILQNSLYSKENVPLQRHDSVYVQTILKHSKNFLHKFEEEVKEKEKKAVYDYVIESNEERKEYLLDLFTKGSIVKHDVLESYLKKVYLNICNSNPDLPKDLKILLSRSPEPNAFSLGNKIIIVNLGLLYFLDTEDQLAFILGHEISHQTQEHLQKDLLKNAKKVNSTEYKNNLKIISKQKYGALTALEKLLIDNNLQKMFHSRVKEFESDSLAALLLTKSSYNSSACITSLQKLDSLNTYNYKTNIPSYNSYFSFEGFPYNKNWEKDSPDEDIWGGTQELDSVWKEKFKSHPDADKRINRISSWIQKMFDTKKAFKDYQIKNLVKEIMFQEFPHYFLENYNTASSIYYSLLLLEENKNDSVAQEIFTMSLYSIYDGLQNHYLNDILVPQDTSYQDDKELLVNILHNLKKTDYEKILENKFSKLHRRETELNSLCFLTKEKFTNSKEISTQLEKFNKKYPRSRYKSLITLYKF